MSLLRPFSDFMRKTKILMRRKERKRGRGDGLDGGAKSPEIGGFRGLNIPPKSGGVEGVEQARRACVIFVWP